MAANTSVVIGDNGRVHKTIECDCIANNIVESNIIYTSQYNKQIYYIYLISLIVGELNTRRCRQISINETKRNIAGQNA